MQFTAICESMSMAPPKKRKNLDAGDRQPNILTFFNKTEPSAGVEEGRGEEVRGADGGERGADGGESSSCLNIVEAGPAEAFCESKEKHRKSGWDPEWLKNPKYSPWLYQTTHGKFQFIDLT